MSFATIIVLSGGVSYEHEVSRESGAGVCSALRQHSSMAVGHVFISRCGRWYLEEEGEQKNIHHPSPSLQHQEGQRIGEVILRYAQHLTGRLCEPHEVCVFPALHGRYGEDGCMQGHLELAGFAYAGPSVLGSALGMDKTTAKRLCGSTDLKTLPFTELRYDKWQQNPASYIAESLQLLQKQMAEPLQKIMVKPCRLGSSLGIGVAEDEAELRSVVTQAFVWDDLVLLEPYLSSNRELSCAVLEQVPEPAQTSQWSCSKLLTSEVGEFPSGPNYLSYTTKYHSTDAICYQLEDAELSQRIQKLSRRIFHLFRLGGMSRVDWLTSSQGELYFNEVNTLPGMGSRSQFLHLWQISGYTTYDVLSRILDHAYHRSQIYRQQRSKILTAQNQDPKKALQSQGI